MHDEAGAKPKSCPICGRPAATGPLRPFCTQRCKDVDLHRWLSGSYALSGSEAEAEETSNRQDAKALVDAPPISPLDLRRGKRKEN